MPPIEFAPSAWGTPDKPTTQWVRCTLQGKYDNIPGIYVVRHKPTRAMYFGATSNLAKAYYSWYQRLRSLTTKPALSPAFRAVFTCREDFEFIVVDEYINAELGALQLAADKLTKTLKEKHRDKCLNMDKTKEEFGFWYERTPPANRPKL